MMVSNRNISFSRGLFSGAMFVSVSVSYIPNIFIMSGWRVFPSLPTGSFQNENQLSHEKKPLVVSGICSGMKSHPGI